MLHIQIRHCTTGKIIVEWKKAVDLKAAVFAAQWFMNSSMEGLVREDMHAIIFDGDEVLYSSLIEDTPQWTPTYDDRFGAISASA